MKKANSSRDTPPAAEPDHPMVDMLTLSVPNRLLRLPDVRKATGLSTTGIYERMKTAAFPKSIPLGGRVVAWRAKDVDQWCIDQFNASREPEKLRA